MWLQAEPKGVLECDIQSVALGLEEATSLSSVHTVSTTYNGETVYDVRAGGGTLKVVSPSFSALELAHVHCSSKLAWLIWTEWIYMDRMAVYGHGSIWQWPCPNGPVWP